MIDRRIILSLTEGVYRVEVTPEHDDHPPLHFGTYRAARGHAGGLRLVTRWPIDDLSPEGGK